MTSYFTHRRIAIAITGGLLAALSFSGVAQAVTETAFKYTTEKTGYFTIHHMAMVPDNNAAAASYNVTWGSGLTSTVSNCFNTGVNLPNSVKISAVTLFYSSGANENVESYLYRYQLKDGTGETIAKKIFFQDDGARRTGVVPILPEFAEVNNAQYAYGFGVCLGNGDTFHGARIEYKYDNAGD